MPIPSIKEQKEIIQIILEEQKIVYGNFDLINKLKIKQKDKIDSLWAETKTIN